MTTVERMGKRSWKSLVFQGILHFYTWRSVEFNQSVQTRDFMARTGHPWNNLWWLWPGVTVPVHFRSYAHLWTPAPPCFARFPAKTMIGPFASRGTKFSLLIGYKAYTWLFLLYYINVEIELTTWLFRHFGGDFLVFITVNWFRNLLFIS